MYIIVSTQKEHQFILELTIFALIHLLNNNPCILRVTWPDLHKARHKALKNIFPRQYLRKLWFNKCTLSQSVSTLSSGRIDLTVKIFNWELIWSKFLTWPRNHVLLFYFSTSLMTFNVKGGLSPIFQFNFSICINSIPMKTSCDCIDWCYIHPKKLIIFKSPWH